MKKHIRRNPYATLVVLTALILFLLFAFIQFLGAFFIIHIERAAAYESYIARSHAPLSPLQSWEEVEQGIFEKYSKGNWAFQIACGNTSTEASLLVFATIFLFGLILGVNVYITFKRIKLLQKRKYQQMQKNKSQGKIAQSHAPRKNSNKTNSKKRRIVA